MAHNKQALKTRIRSIKATKKITSAMELIANAKLAKQRMTMEKNREFITILQQSVADIMASNKEIESRFLQKKSSQKTMTIIFSSDLGLCGAYNINMYKLFTSVAKKEDPCIVFGSRLYSSIKSDGYDIINELMMVDHLNYDKISKLLASVIEMYAKDEISKIQVIYTKFINTVTFEASLNVLLPYISDIQGNKQETIFDPSPSEVLDKLIVMMIDSVVYGLSLETKTAEQASRRLAMENANDNADELEEKLTLAYNQARQASITQEITEIVSGADAL